MQESNTPDSNSGDDGAATSGARHRRPSSRAAGRNLLGGRNLPRGRDLLKGRRPIIALAATAVLGIGIAGVATASSGGGDAPVATSVTADAQDRERATERADRSERQTPTTPPAATAGPTDAADPKAAPADAQSKAAEPGSPSTGSGQSQGTPERTTAAPEPTRQAPTTAAADWVSPMPGAATTSCYGQRWGALHAGIDLAKPADTPIQAAGAGTVTITGWAYAGYGISVVIDHGNGVFTHYAHQSRTAVSVGQRVSAGQVIGYEGSTGDSTGPHLHFEVHLGMWNQVDPGPWMRERGVDLGC